MIDRDYKIIKRDFSTLKKEEIEKLKYHDWVQGVGNLLTANEIKIVKYFLMILSDK